MVLARILATSALFMWQGASATDADIHRAKTPLPRQHLTASDFESRSRMFNAVLADVQGLETRACEDYELKDVMALRDVLISATSAELNAIYESAGDRRRLSFASVRPCVPEDKLLTTVMRDALCIEAVNLYTHHVMEEQKVEFHALSSLPLMPESEHTRDATRARHLQVSHVSNAELEEVFDEYDTSSVCNMCHSNFAPGPNDEWVFDDTIILTPAAPVFPDAFYTVLAVNRTGVRFADGTVDPDFKGTRVAILHHYNYTNLSARYEQIFQDSMPREIVLRVGQYLYTFWPEERRCTAYSIGFNIHAPNWLQLGPVGTEATREPNEVIDGVEVEVWNRQEPDTGFSHRLYWNREYNKPVLNYFEGGPFVTLFQHWADFVPNDPEYPGIWDIPSYCPEPIPQDPNSTTPTSGIERSGVPGQDPEANTPGAVSSGEASSMAIGNVVGIAAACTVFGGFVGVVAVLRIGRQDESSRGSQLMEPVLQESYSRSYEMSASDMDLSAQIASEQVASV